MPDELRRKMTLWISDRDRDNMVAIKEVYGLSSESAAIRYALQAVSREARTVADNEKTA